ncbi:MAG TPA: hypothetical protein VFX15_08425, partial [Actinomycetes bacterium]|nr:hypothetical protein [Actinomycetes bacterium]
QLASVALVVAVAAVVLAAVAVTRQVEGPQGETGPVGPPGPAGATTGLPPGVLVTGGFSSCPDGTVRYAAFEVPDLVSDTITQRVVLCAVSGG